MHIVETKNNLVRVSYDASGETLVLSGFIVIKDQQQSFIGQIIHLEAITEGNFAVVKLLFNFDDEGVITNYNGSVPSIACPLDVVYPQELLELLPVKNPVVLGELAQQKTTLKVDRNVFENKLLVCCEKEDDAKFLIENIVQQLAESGKNALIFDLNGDIDYYTKKIVACKDFKLPLNYESINFIYEKGLDDAKAETKALIQSIFLEVQDYVKTLPDGFIPFESFKEVVDEQYEETDLTELVLLKNKLLKYYEAGVFAQDKSEFINLQNALQSEIATVLDLSKTDDKIQREMVSYAYNLIEKSNKNIYVIFNVKDDNSDKKLLKQIFTSKKSYSTLICEYSYKYLKELKQLSKDLILFAPIQQQSDFAGYNVFLSKLNPHEYVIYGQATHHFPLIVKLNEKPLESIKPQQPVFVEESLDEQIRRDVDEIYSVPKSEKIEMPQTSFEDEIIEQQNESMANEDKSFGVEVVSDDLTDEDLDLIEEMDELSLAEANVKKYMEQPQQEQEEAQEQFKIVEEISQDVPQETVQWPEEEPSYIEQEIEELPEDSSEFTEEEFVEQKEPVVIKPKDGPVLDILPAQAASTPIVPIYSADVEQVAESDIIGQGDTVVHPKYGKGVVEKMISYGSKTLCSINFDNVGRRLLDPTLAEIKKS